MVRKGSLGRRIIPGIKKYIRIPSHLWAVLLLGIISQLGQVLLLRELLMVFHGNELSIGLILASWMFWVGAGSGLGSLLVKRIKAPLLLLTLSAVALFLILPSTVILIRGLRGFFQLLPGAYLSLLDMTLSSLLVLAPACLLLGLQFLLLARIWRQRDRVEDTSGAEKTYVGEAAGNMVGGILFALFLVHHLNSLQLALTAAGLMLLVLLFMLHKPQVYSERIPPYWRWIIVGLLAAALLLFPLLEEINHWAHRMQWQYFAPQYQLVETHQSKHGSIAILKHEDQYSFFQSGQLVFSTAGPETMAPGLEEQEAASFAHLAMVQHKEPEKILLIGGGLRGTLGEIIKHPVARVDYLELDEVLARAARPYLSSASLKALDNPRVNTIHMDGRLFVKRAEEKYDMIILDLPDPATAVLNRYYTREFFQEAKELLRPEGVLVTAVTSSPDLRGKALANRNSTIYHTLRESFSRVLPAGDRFLLYAASDQPDQITVEAAKLQERYLERGIESEGFSAHHYQLLLEESRLLRINWVLRNHGRSPEAHLSGPARGPLSPPPIKEQIVQEQELPPAGEYFINSDFKPIGYYYTLIFWNQLTRTTPTGTLQWLLQVEFWWLFPLFSLFLLVGILLHSRARAGGNDIDLNYAVLFTLFATGLSTMALQIALIFSFQSIYGFVYEMVGLIVAIFMCGLALGALLSQKYIQEKTNIKLLATVQLIMALLAAIIGIIIPRAATVQSSSLILLLFSSLTFFAGLINGIDFPLATACYSSLTAAADRAAGTAYGIELLGACLGSILASAVIAPILGIVACTLMAALASSTAFIILIIVRRQKPL